MLIRTRFAPSPTGTLHIGSVRTAFYSWLYARHMGGKFILRIEDTDELRSTKVSLAAILDGFKWLELDYDEGPIYQMDRLEIYKSYAKKLIDEGKAYRCTCNKERLEALREQQILNKQKPRYDGCCRDKDLKEIDESFVVRLKTPHDGVVNFDDMVYGSITVANSELDDLVLLRSDGLPTYNFAVVIDDSEMNITHIIRGDDHINNTPRQIHLYNAIQAKLPIFAHLPMLLGDDGKRLSKRHGAVNVLEFHEMGFLPHALLNYLVRLGWSHGDQEIFSLEEMIKCFDLKNISRSPSSFNHEKLLWLNQHYLKNLSAEDMQSALTPIFIHKGIDIASGPALAEIGRPMAERCKTLVEIADKSEYLYQDNIIYDPIALEKHILPQVEESLVMFLTNLQLLAVWEVSALKELLEKTCSQLNIGMGKLAQPLRVLLTGNTNSPSIDLVMYWLERDKVQKRINWGLEYIRKLS